MHNAKSGAGVLDVVIGREVAYHDVWCGPGNAPGQVQGHPERYEGATALFDIRSLCADPNVKIGLIASGDKFVSTPGDLEAVFPFRLTWHALLLSFRAAACLARHASPL